MNSLNSSNQVGSGYTGQNKAAAPQSNGVPKDVVTLNLKPEQMADKSIQAFIRQMAMEGTPVNLNFAESTPQSSTQAPPAQSYAKDAQIYAQQAQAEAERAQRIANSLKSASTYSAPPTHSEG
jgi:hypothetical protein